MRPIVSGLRTGIGIFAGITCLWLGKTLVEALLFAKHQKILQIKVPISTIFHFGKRCVWGEQNAIGDPFLRTIQAATLTFSLERIEEVVDLKFEWARKKLSHVLHRKIHLALSSDQPIPKSFTLSLKKYSPLLTEYTLNDVRGDRLAEMGPAFENTTKLTIEQLTEPKNNSLMSLKNLTFLEIKSDHSTRFKNTPNDAWLENSLYSLPHLETLKIGEMLKIEGTFWKTLLPTVKNLQIPKFDGAERLGISVANLKTNPLYEEIIINRISEKGAQMLQKSLHAKTLTIESFYKPGFKEKWDQDKLRQALKSKHIQTVILPSY